MRRDLHDHQSHGMIRLIGRFGAQADTDDLIAEHVDRAIGVGQRTLFDNLVDAVVAQAADVAAAVLTMALNSANLA